MVTRIQFQLLTMAPLIWSMNYFKDLTSCHALTHFPSQQRSIHTTFFLFFFFFFSNMPNSLRSKDLCPSYFWFWECDFLPSNYLELNSNVPSLMLRLAILAKVYSTSTFFIICIYFLPSTYAYLKLCIYLVFLCLFSNRIKSPLRAKTSYIPSMQDSV